MFNRILIICLMGTFFSIPLGCTDTNDSDEKSCFCTLNFRLQDVNIGDNALGYQTAQWNSADANLRCHELLNREVEIIWTLYTYSGQAIITRTENYRFTTPDIERGQCNP